MNPAFNIFKLSEDCLYPRFLSGVARRAKTDREDKFFPREKLT